MSSSKAAWLLPNSAALTFTHFLNSGDTTVANCTVRPVRRAERPSDARTAP